MIKQVESKASWRCLDCGSYVTPRTSGSMRAWDCPNRACVRYSTTQVLPKGKLPMWIEYDDGGGILTRPLKPEQRTTEPVVVFGLLITGVLVSIIVVIVAHWLGVRLL